MSNSNATMKMAGGSLAAAPQAQDRARVLLFPPLVGLTLLLAGIVLQLYYPLTIAGGTNMVLLAGGVVLAIGIVLQIVCMRTFRRAGTTPLFRKPTTRILQSGPYARSRNPIYIAVFIQFIGMALLVNTWWLVAVLPVLYVYLRFGVIAREERHLEQKFGDGYREYKARVRRWL